MSWDRKRRGASTGYYYRSVRVPDKPYPVKVYFGRRTAGHLAAAEVEQRRRDREHTKAAVRAERDVTAEIDRLASELHERAATRTGRSPHHATWLSVTLSAVPPASRCAHSLR